jgi:ABC-type multidrug transport system fused ATPase/permease subunit
MNNIDAETEALIGKAISEEWAGKTVIAVVHKLDDMVKEGALDKFVVMESGKVAEVREPAQITVRGGGCFRRLWGGRA